MSHADEPAKGGKIGSVTEVTYDSVIDQCIVAPDAVAKAFLRALERIVELEALRVDSMATRLQQVAGRLGCPLGVDIIDWTADRIELLEAAMRRIVESGAYPEAAIAAEALGGAP